MIAISFYHCSINLWKRGSLNISCINKNQKTSVKLKILVAHEKNVIDYIYSLEQK